MSAESSPVSAARCLTLPSAFETPLGSPIEQEEDIYCPRSRFSTATKTQVSLDILSFPKPIDSPRGCYDVYSRNIELSIRKLEEIFIRRSFEIQIEDSRFLHPITIRAQVLTGRFSPLQYRKYVPKIFNGTSEELVNMISKTVYMIINELDFNGLTPFISMLDQYGDGKTFNEIKIDCKEDGVGGICSGRTYAVLKRLKEKHNVEGMFAAVRMKGHSLDHGQVVIECKDGFVVIDPTQDPPICSVPFGETRIFNQTKQSQLFKKMSPDGAYFYTASEPGSLIPLVYQKISTGEIFECCVGIDNADDIIGKYAIMHSSSLSPYVIRLYSNSPLSDRHDLSKFILISLKNSKVIFKDTGANSLKERTKEFTFEFIRSNGLLKELTDFLKPKYYCKPTFHTSVDTLTKQIEIFVSREFLLQHLIFEQTAFD